ncbi:MAG TPA: SDR family oxidoreductase [Gemmatimonadaceae bacterium]
MSAPLTGRTAVVTGASRGIGVATARAFVAAGARVAMLARDRAALEARAGELGDAALPIVCDVTDTAAIARAVDAIAHHAGGAPDVLVNNAGLFVPQPLDDTTVDTFARTVDVNLVAPFALVKAFLPRMRERGSGHIVTIGSVADRTTFPGNAAYSASKYGLRALHEIMRTELRGSGIRATLVSPGPTDTTIWDAVDVESQPGRFPPRSAMLRPEAVAAAVLYAVSQPPAVNVDELRLSSA